jgi:TPR repeat protein
LIALWKKAIGEELSFQSRKHALYNLGHMHSAHSPAQPQTVKEDLPQSVGWLMQAAELGSTSAVQQLMMAGK